jgi:uncharacterized protein with von Willebrand factor type A (vWA) domain
MQQNPKDTMLHILRIAGITDNTEAYADEFLRLCENRAFVDVIKTLPEEQQQQFQQRIAEVTEKNSISEIMGEYISAEKYTMALEKASQVIFKQCMDTILPNLSQEQLRNLQAYMQSLQTGS